MLAFLLHDGNNGGVAVWSNYAQAQLDVNIDVTRIDNVTTSVNLKSFSYRAFITIYRRIASSKTQIVIVGNSTPSVLVRLVKLFKPNLKIVYVTHGWGWSYQKGIKRILSWLIEFITLPLVDCVVSISSRDMIICKKYFLRESILLKNINFKLVPRKDELKRIEKVLFVGRDAYPKRLDLFIHLASLFQDIEFYVVGANGNKTENLFYLGELEDFTDYATYDAFILLSDSEGSPLVVQEALSAGLPCLVNRLDYVNDLDQEWEGLLYVANDLSVKNIAYTFRRMQKSNHMSPKIARKKMEKLQFEWSLKFNEIIKMYYD